MERGKNRVFADEISASRNENIIDLMSNNNTIRFVLSCTGNVLALFCFTVLTDNKNNDSQSD